MGYFSNLAIDRFEDYEDHSYPSPERQLLWRLDDLKDRSEGLITEGISYRNGHIYTENDIRYALPGYLGDISKVERAIELAREDLLNQYGVDVYEAEEKDAAEEGNAKPEYEDGYKQITLIDVILPVILSQSKVASPNEHTAQRTGMPAVSLFLPQLAGTVALGGQGEVAATSAK